MDWRTPRAAYIHVPFCSHHCGYCDFAVSTDAALQTLYLEALAVELRGEPVAIDTIFIGGGTPTLLAADQLARLLSLIRDRFPGPLLECSIESTPDSITAEKLAVLRDAGLTRISIGVQSFHAETLHALDRQHSIGQIGPAVEAARGAGLAVSLDLIFAAPGQTLDAWRADLEAAIRIAPDHISTYGLTYEKGTPLWKRRARGLVLAADDDLELAMYQAAMQTLAAAGYEHYEISNFAQPGRRCRHNEIYWANHAYFGFGVGAAQYVNGERRVNIRDTRQYIRRMLAGESPVQSRECLAPRERAYESAAIQLRRGEGISHAAFREQTGFDWPDLAGDTLHRIVALGLLEADSSGVRLTAQGKCVADAIIAEFMTGR